MGGGDLIFKIFDFMEQQKFINFLYGFCKSGSVMCGITVSQSKSEKSISCSNKKIIDHIFASFCKRASIEKGGKLLTVLI